MLNDGTAVISHHLFFANFSRFAVDADRLSGALPNGEYQFQHRRIRSSEIFVFPLFSACLLDLFDQLTLAIAVTQFELNSSSGLHGLPGQEVGCFILHMCNGAIDFILS